MAHELLSWRCEKGGCDSIHQNWLKILLKLKSFLRPVANASAIPDTAIPKTIAIAIVAIPIIPIIAA